jgi:hypothetical protein
MRPMASEQMFLKTLGLVPLVFALAAGAPSRVSAQDRVVVEPSPAPPGDLRIIVEPPITTPAAPAEPQQPTRAPMSEQDEYRHAELSWLAFRSRNIFIGSSVATAVGAALVFPAEANQCPGDEMSLNRCTPGGKAMVVIGYPLLLIGGISMVASGIVFGVMKGKLRRFEQRAARRESRALRWDPAGSRFVF